jgi:Tfp pilus assembly protein PilN
MIEINLLPGSVKRSRRKVGVGLSAGPLANLKLPKMDRILAASIAMTTLAVVLIAYMQIHGSRTLKAVTLEEEALVRDTASMSLQIAQNAALNAKQDTIVQKLTVIQELDQGRFDWAHILDEIARAVPDYTWLTSITPTETGVANPVFRIEGRMANSFALPLFMQQLEASPFIANVTLRGSGAVPDESKALYSFSLEAAYEEPPIDLIQTEPLFSPDMQPDSAVTAEIAAKKAGKE